MSFLQTFQDRHQPIQVRSVAGLQPFFYGARRFEDSHVQADKTAWADTMPFDVFGATHVTVQVTQLSGSGAFTVNIKGAMDDDDTPVALPTPVAITTTGLTRITDFPTPLLYLSVDNPNNVELLIKIYATR